MHAPLVPALRFAWLVVASFFAGVLNAIAGGGSFVSPPALLASIGGYVGAHFSRRVNQRVMRWTVTAIGFLASGYFLLLNALSHP